MNCPHRQRMSLDAVTIVTVISAVLNLGAVVVAAEPASSSNPVQTVMVPMRDKVKLATDIYLPVGNGPFPVVLMRTPYNKAGSAGVGAAGTMHGYGVVIQDTRGRFASEGENLPFNREAPDGQDTVKWVARQGWCNGRIGTSGGSALGIAQLQLAPGAPAELVAQHIVVGAPNIWDVVYTGGVFRKALVEDWLRTSHFSPRALELWTGHDYYDKYWQERDASRQYGKVNVPAVHVGGYYDIFSQATIDAFLGYQTKGGPGARGKQKLLMGPWTHSVLTEKSGELVFPKAERPPNDVQDQFRWWECYLKGVNNGVSDLPAVTYYVMGDVSDPKAPGNLWRTADQWPPVPTRRTRWYLGGDQTLSENKPVRDENLSYIYDPANPVPTVGGYQLTIPAGPRDQRSIETRPDVLVFTSGPLAQPLEVTGRPRAALWASTDVPDTDFLVRLCDVYPDGRSYNVSEGILRARFRRSFQEEEMLKPGAIYSLGIDLPSTSIIFNKGHRLRVHVTSSSAPGYDPNPNTGEALHWSDRQQAAHTTVYISGIYTPYLELPVATQTK